LNFVTTTRSGKHIQGIFKTNSKQILAGDGTIKDAIFLTASRINHSCAANAIFSFHIATGEGRVRIIQNVEGAIEITIDYSCKLKPKEVRQQRLEEEFGFRCACEICTKEGFILAASDTNWKDIRDLTRECTSKETRRYDPMKCLANLDNIWGLMKRERIGGGKVSTFFNNTFDLLVGHGDLARGQCFCNDASRI
jgi:hypothetical protein